MSRILIASIGDPRRRPGTNEYSQTTYAMTDAEGRPNGFEYTGSYIFEALAQLENIDTLILIGTAGSLWNALYEYLVLEEDSPLRRADLQEDDDYLEKLEGLYNSPHKPELDIGEVAHLLEKLEQSFNPRYHVKLITMRYGLSDKGWDKNLNVLRDIDDILKDGDELYLDVTYSFRSLPIFQLLSVFYLLRNISQKDVKLKMLSYGMFEVSSEFGGKTPIVDLRRLYELMEYIKVAGEYRSFGTTYGLAALADSGELVPGLSPQQSKLIRNLGDMVTINNLQGFEELVKECEWIGRQQGVAAAYARYLRRHPAVFRGRH